MLENIIYYFSFKEAVATLVVVYLIFKVSTWISTWISEVRKIQALGGYAPRVRSYLPLGMDKIASGIYHNLHHKNLEFQQGLFGPTGHWAPSGFQPTVEAYLGGERVIFTIDPENIKAVLATQFHDFGKGEQFHMEWHEFLGDSIFTTDLEQWHSSRQLIRPQFIKDRVSDLEIFEKHVQVLLPAIANGGVSGSPGTTSDGIGRGRHVDVSDLFFRYTLDATTDFLLGRSVKSLEILKQPFAEAFSIVQSIQSNITRAGPFAFAIPRGSFGAGLRIVNDFVNPFIEEALLLSPEELAIKTSSGAGFTFLHALAGFTKDRKVLRDQLVAVLLAGRDTTASTLSWTFYELARHPEVFKKLRDEIIRTVGQDRLPTYVDLKNMKFLRNTIDETLRLYPSIPFNVRLALHDTTLPRGGGPDGLSPVGVNKGTHVAYSALLMQRRPEIYPPSADPSLAVENFNPDRWSTWQPKPWTYIPFNGGPRICIGQQFALTEISYTIVRILQRFDRIDSFMPEGKTGKPILKAEIVLQPGNGVTVGFWDSNESLGR